MADLQHGHVIHLIPLDLGHFFRERITLFQSNVTVLSNKNLWKHTRLYIATPF